MAIDRAEHVHETFLRCLEQGRFPKTRSRLSPQAAGLSPSALAAIYMSQLASRQLDRSARDLQKRGLGYYTIGSSGHEGMAAVADALRPSDMAFLHYRDAAFQIHRATQVPGETPLWDIMLSFVASAEDPISGGRHKVLGSRRLNIPPQTSTIASHLPKAVGAAFSLGLAPYVTPEFPILPDDAIVMCSFGDASANHSTAQGAFNTASWTAYQGGSLPLLFVCEDNGIGISTRTPENWISESFKRRPALKYFAASGVNILEAYKVAREAADYVRNNQSPAFLHLKTVRLYGHAGSDVQGAYMHKTEIEAGEANDPLLHGAGILVNSGAMTADEIGKHYVGLGNRLSRIGEQVVLRPKLETPDDVMASIVPPKRTLLRTNSPSASDRAQLFGREATAI